MSFHVDKIEQYYSQTQVNLIKKENTEYAKRNYELNEENIRLQYEVEDLQDCLGMTASENEELKDRNIRQSKFIRGLEVTDISCSTGYKTFYDLPQAKKQEAHIVELKNKIKELEDQIERCKFANAYILEIFEYMNEKIHTDEFVPRDILTAAEEENQKLIEQNWKLEKTYMHSRDYILSPDGEEWYKPMGVENNVFSTYYYKTPIGKVI